MPNSLFQKGLNWVYNHFKKNTAKMLIYTGVAGWALSSIAQIGAVACNPKISKEQKSFLIPQEIWDMFINVGSFFLVTLTVKKMCSRLASTGKFAPEKVRNFLNKHKDLYGDKVGKLDLDLDLVLKNHKDFPIESYYAYKNKITTIGTVAAGVVSSNIITPVVRNVMASNAQKKYLDKKTHLAQPAPSGNMKI